MRPKFNQTMPEAIPSGLPKLCADMLEDFMIENRIRDWKLGIRLFFQETAHLKLIAERENWQLRLKDY